jgi:hypothetical protein
MDTGADITNLLTEAMNDPDVPDLFADQHRELLLRVRDAYDERWTIMTTELMIQDKQNHDYIYELYLDTSKALQNSESYSELTTQDTSAYTPTQTHPTEYTQTANPMEKSTLPSVADLSKLRRLRRRST